MGFRGYLQVPLETRYNTVVAVTVGSVFFALTHLTQPWAMPILPHLFGLSVLLGILAHASASLIPAIVAHLVLDLVNFSYWWSNVAGSFERRPIGAVGMDPHFLASLTVLAVGVGFFVWAIRMLRSGPRSAATQGRPGAEKGPAAQVGTDR